MKSNFLKRKILGIKREYKVLVLILNDLTFLLVALALSYYLLSDVSIVETKLSYYSFSICIAGILVFYLSGISRNSSFLPKRFAEANHNGLGTIISAVSHNYTIFMIFTYFAEIVVLDNCLP